MHRSFALGLVALALIPGAQAVQLLPAGEFRARDGRPENLSAWKLDAATAAALIERVRARATRPVVDYEHQSLHAEKNGQAAPAAGWIDPASLQWREGQGLFARVEWTERAAAMIAAGEYRYLSPVLLFDKRTGVVVDLLMAAVTNTPAIDGMDEVTLRAAARYLPEESAVDRTKLIAALGLKAEATDTEIEAAIAALNTSAKQIDDLQTQLAALKTATPDPSKFVPVETMRDLQTQLAALSARITGSEVDQVVSQALTDGKLLPAQEAWARELGAKDLAALKSYLDKTPAIAALRGTQTQGKAPGDDPKGEALSDMERAVCRNMGLKPEAFRAAQLQISQERAEAAAA
ncbi:MAG: phage protease [Burkholderiales bacterium]|nr:phage protease [Burkholderiales bacterium]